MRGPYSLGVKWKLFSDVAPMREHSTVSVSSSIIFQGFILGLRWTAGMLSRYAAA